MPYADGDDRGVGGSGDVKPNQVTMVISNRQIPLSHLARLVRLRRVT